MELLSRCDGDPLFCKLLDDEGERGFYGVEFDDLAEVEQSYLSNTAVLITRGLGVFARAPRCTPIRA
jgi:hypothetical protein